MTPQTSQTPDPSFQSDPLLVYLERKRSQSGSCPARDEWKAYFKETLSDDREEALKNHLVVCHACSVEAIRQEAKDTHTFRNHVAIATALVLFVGIGLAIALLRPSHQANVSFVRLEPVDQTYRNQAPIQTISHEPAQSLILQFNTEDLETYASYRVELLEGPSERIIWQDDSLQRQPDRSFVIDVPARYRQGRLHLRLRGDNHILADYHLQLIEP